MRSLVRNYLSGNRVAWRYMGTRSTSVILAVLNVCMLSGACAPRSTPARTPAGTAASGLVTSSRNTHEGLNGVLWMQTAAEYWALTSAAYRNAQTALEESLRDTSWTASLEQGSGYESRPGAVILDLDETVLDNSPFQAQLVLERTFYQSAIWKAWVDEMAAGLVPGSKDFIAFAEGKGIRTFYVTNRTLDEQDKTLKNLAALGISASDATVLCVGENGWTSDKTARRAEIAKTHRILLLIGDDMNDFVSTASLLPLQRAALAQTHARFWGRAWVLLPNPLYGSWERALYPGLSEDNEILARKRSQVKGFRQQ
jgi:5'-nucleotidase (lipoprotein e(P4) family)